MDTPEAPTGPPIPPELAALTDSLDGNLHTLAAGNNDIRDAALKAAKCVFDLAMKSEPQAKPHIDKLLATLGPANAPETRSQARKRKRSPSPAPIPTFQTTPLAALYTDGMDDDQVWSQLDLRSKQLCDMLDFVLEGELPDTELEDDEPEEEDGMEVDGDEELDGLEGFDDEDESLDDEEDEDEEDEDVEDSSSVASQTERIQDLRDASDGEEDEPDALSLLERMDKRPSRIPTRRKRGHPELDDGFFDLAAFNAETEEAESRQVSRGHLNEDDSDNDDNISVDLFAPVDDEQALEESDDEQAEPYYKDFFEPPKKSPTKGKGKAASPKKAGGVRFHDEVRVKNIKKRGKGLPVNYDPAGDEDEDDDDEYDEAGELPDDSDDDEEDEDEDEDASDDDEDMEEDESDAESSLDGLRGKETIDRLKDDLFADEEDEEEAADMTAHERRMAALREQIAELEQENVGEKDWVLMGEVDSRKRPQNSLLEEDLEFERLSKAIPVETEEVIKSLEERIKARILANDFDDVVRIRPVDDKPFLPSRFFELKDKKSEQGLAEIYEDEYVAAQSGVGTDDRDGKLKKEHDELDKMWEGICYKLDALSNAHFTPKQVRIAICLFMLVTYSFINQPKASISTISNMPTASLESALPTAVSTTSMLAPQEIHAPKPSDLRARTELTPAEKRALHHKERKAKRKMRDTLEKSVDKFARMKGAKGTRKQKEEALRSVVKSGKGVTVVGKKNKEILEQRGKKGKKACIPKRALMAIVVAAYNADCILSLRGSLPVEFLPPILAQAQAEDLIRWEEDWPEIAELTRPVWKNVLRKRFPKEWQQLEAEDKNPESWSECFTLFKEQETRRFEEAVNKLRNARADEDQRKQLRMTKVDAKLPPPKQRKYGQSWAPKTALQKTYTKASRQQQATFARTAPPAFTPKSYASLSKKPDILPSPSSSISSHVSVSTVVHNRPTASSSATSSSSSRASSSSSVGPKARAVTSNAATPNASPVIRSATAPAAPTPKPTPSDPPPPYATVDPLQRPANAVAPAPRPSSPDAMPPPAKRFKKANKMACLFMPKNRAYSQIAAATK
ncbi:Mpp10 protein-domain-containing protein [Schizophyllum commune]